MLLMPLENYEERLLLDTLLTLLPAPCSSHSLQLSSETFCQHHLTQRYAVTETSQKSDNVWEKFNPACVGCPVPLCKMAWGKERCTFSAGLVREASQLLCSLLVRKQIYTSAKVWTSRLGMHSIKKGRVSLDNAKVASSEMHSNTGCERAPLCSIMLGCTGYFVWSIPKMEVLEQHVHTSGVLSKQRLALMDRMNSWFFTVVSAQTKPLC